MSYTFTSAKYANAQNTAAVAMTNEKGAVLLSQTDTPSDWAALSSSGISIGAYVPAPAMSEDYPQIFTMKDTGNGELVTFEVKNGVFTKTQGS